MSVVTEFLSADTASLPEMSPEMQIAMGSPEQQMTAIGQIYEETAPDLVRRMHRIGQGGEAEDIVHDAFERGIRHASTFIPDTARGWLFRIATNRAVDVHRHLSRVFPTDPSAPEAAAAFENPMFGQGSADPEDAGLRVDSERRLAPILSFLTEDQRDVVQRVLIGGEDPEAYAATKDIKPATVRSRQSRAISLLRQLIKDGTIEADQEAGTLSISRL